MKQFIPHFKAVLMYMVLFFACSAKAQTTVTGKIMDKEGKPVPFAMVVLKNAAAGAVTDTLGGFKITTAKTGSDTVIVKCVGYDSYYYPVVLAGKEIPVQIRLSETEAIFNEVLITAGTIEASNERSVAVLRPLDIVTTAGGQGDIFGAIQTLPGVQRNGGDQTGLMVRGGDVNESIVIIDGAVAQNAFFSNVPGVSQRGRFNPFQFKGTAFSSGGYTARYGQALSAVLDLQTNDLPEKDNINIGFNLAGAYLSGAKLIDNNAVEFAGGYTNVTPFFALNPTNVDFYDAPQGGTFSTRWVSKLDNNKGIFKMNFTHAVNTSGIVIPDPETAGSTIDFKLTNENTYFNTSFKYWVSPKLRYFTAFSFSSNTDHIKISNVDVLRLDGRVQGRAEVWYEFARKFNVLAGVDIQRITYSQKYDTLLGAFEETISAAYVEGEYKPTRRFVIKPGVRAEYSQLIARGNVVPRLAFAYRLAEGHQLSFAGGMFYQTAAPQYLMQGYRPQFQQAVHYMANYQFMQNDRTFRVEAYYKSYDQLIRENGVAYNPNPYRFYYGMVDNSGSGYAQGIDVFWRDRKSIKNFDYWISYSFIDTKRLYQNYLAEATPDFVSEHNLSVVAKYFVERLQTNFSATYNYASGRAYYNPNSPVFLSDHAPDYHNFALTVSYLTTIKKMFAVFYLSVDNITNQKNILGYRYSYTGVDRYPILPPMYRSIFFGVNLSLSEFNKDEL